MPDNNLIKLVRRTLLSALRASVGTAMFQHVYVRRKTDGKEFDTMDGGDLSCAFYVSGVLAICGLIDRAHSVVPTTIERTKEAGWYKVNAPKPGCVVYWPKYDGHEHIGFMLSADEYISNWSLDRTPQIHKAQLPDGRVPEAYYWHKALNED